MISRITSKHGYHHRILCCIFNFRRQKLWPKRCENKVNNLFYLVQISVFLCQSLFLHLGALFLDWFPVTVQHAQFWTFRFISWYLVWTSCIFHDLFNVWVSVLGCCLYFFFYNSVRPIKRLFLVVVKVLQTLNIRWQYS